MKPFKITLNLNSESPPHLYVRQIKDLISKDNYLHPMLKNLLLMLKKARMPYTRLSQQKELVLVPSQHYHFERATSPEIHAWVKIPWSEEETQEYEENPKIYIESVLKLQNKIGYDFYDKVEQTEEDIQSLNEITKKKDKKKKWWKK